MLRLGAMAQLHAAAAARHPHAHARLGSFLAANVYVSEGRDAAVVDSLLELASGNAGAALGAHFVDQPYNRSSYTLVGRSPEGLSAAAVALARAALAALDLRRHAASHPRLGTVDHISLHPLGSDGRPAAAGMPEAAAAARLVAEALGQGPHAVPTYLYGAAHPQARPLADLRRRLGYFRPQAAGGQWQGALPPPPAPLPPCFGPAEPPPDAGVCCVGAVPWLVNFNVLLDTADAAAAREVARAVGERGGGLPSVQAMALQHGDGEAAGGRG